MLRRSRSKKLKTSLIAGLCLALASSGGAGWAQKPDDVVIQVDTHLVVLHATVVDKNGHLVTTLPQSAFQVYENGARQQLKLFKREDIPVSLGLVIDNSGSMLQQARQGGGGRSGSHCWNNPEDETKPL